MLFSYEKVPCFVVFTDIVVINTLTMADFTFQSDIIKFGVRKRHTPVFLCRPALAHSTDV